MTRQHLLVISCHLPEKGRKEIEETVEEMKERDMEERGTGMKVKNKRNKRAQRVLIRSPECHCL